MLSCREEEAKPRFSGKVLIVGAGAGGLSAGYLLRQHGIDFEILEASPRYGGRMRIHTSFADFPIPLGAEWLETHPSVFREMVNDPAVTVAVETIEDAPDRKFVNSSWFQFFETYILPSVRDNITFNAPVTRVNYSEDGVRLETANQQYAADKVIMAVPLQIIKEEAILFSPALPTPKRAAIEELPVWAGFKAFFEFDSGFFPDDEHVFEVTPSTAGEKIFYNAGLGQNTSKHIMGVFVVGEPALAYTSLTGDALRDKILAEMDAVYNNQASAHYVKHITQNWNSEEFIRSGYLSDHADWRQVRELGKSVNDKLYFAGAEFTDGEDWVSVHTAAQSARRVVEEISSS